MRFIRLLIRLRHNPTLFLPVTRGPLHGFYHFFTGYFLPLYWHQMRRPKRRFAVVDCTPFNHWFSYLPGSPPEVVGMEKALKVSYRAKNFGFASGYRVKALVGWDKWLRFYKRPLAEIATEIQKEFSQRTQENATESATIVIFGRDHTPEHYQENLPTRYGVAKRNIPNLADAATYLNDHIPTTLVDPVLLTPEEVFAVCHRAKVVVGQHGAALTNVIFMPPGRQVVEIAWPALDDNDVKEMYRLLCEVIGLKWTRPILQTHKHSEIDPKSLEAHIRMVLGEK